MKFPKVVEAVAAMEKSQWRIGDALLAEIPMGKDSSHNEALAELEECAEELSRRGFDLTPQTLANYRYIANAFPPSRRRDGISWNSHRDAGTPDMLDAMGRAIILLPKITARKDGAKLRRNNWRGSGNWSRDRAAALRVAKHCLTCSGDRRRWSDFD